MAQARSCPQSDQVFPPQKLRNPSRLESTPSEGGIQVGISLLKWGGMIGSRDYQATGSLAQSRACVYKTRPLGAKLCAGGLAVHFHPGPVASEQEDQVHRRRSQSRSQLRGPMQGVRSTNTCARGAICMRRAPKTQLPFPPRTCPTGVLPCKQARNRTETKDQRSSRFLGCKSWSRLLLFLDVSRTWEPHRGLGRLFVQSEQGGLTFVYFFFFFFLPIARSPPI